MERAYTMSTVYVICPANAVTGGPELLHQLVKALNDADRPAFIVYAPFSARHQVPAAYAQYNIPVAQRSDIEPGSEVVIPEMWPAMIDRFPGCRINFWWLSVDNFFSLLIHHRIRRLLPKAVENLAQRILKSRALRQVRRANRHLYQSEYARLFLEEIGLAPTRRLGDYINKDYLDLIGAPLSSPRRDIVAYNPAKGRERAVAVINALKMKVGDSITAVPIVNMSRSEVRELLATSKVYMDLGHHPGKDRIPREAAAAGACVLVNCRGSAGNPVDVPVSDFYRIDDTGPDFASEAASKIVEIIGDFDAHRRSFDDYRRRIADEPSEFIEDAQRAFSS